MIYQFRRGSRVAGVSAQIVGDALAELREKHGVLQTETVLMDARRKRSKLHAAFEWDDEIAGHEFRLIQARQLIRSIVVILEDGDEPAYVHINVGDSRYYQSTEVACRNVDEWQLVRETALRSLRGASDNLDRLDAVAHRIEHEKRGDVRRVKTVVQRAAEQLAAT